MINLKSRCRVAGIILLLPVSAGPFFQSASAIKDSADLWTALIAARPDDREHPLESLRHHIDLISAALCQELIRRANVAYRASDFDQAALFFELAREAAILSKNKAVLKLSGIHRLGRIYSAGHNSTKAIEADIRSKEIFEEIKSSVDLIFLLADLGDFLMSVDDPVSARNYSAQCLALASDLKPGSDMTATFAKEWGLGAAWSNLARISVWEGDFNTALDYLHRSLELSRSRSVRNPDWIAQDLIRLAQVHNAMGDYRQALNCLTEGAEIARRLKINSLLTQAYDTFGILCLHQADYTSAIKWLNMSMNLAVQSGNKRGLAIYLADIGDAYLAQENPDAAIQNYQNALKTAEAIGFPDVVLMIKRSLGVAYSVKGDLELALSILEDATRLADRAGDKNRIAEISCSKGEVYYSMGNHSRAADLADQAYGLSEHMGRPRLVLSSLTLRAKASLAQGKNEVAQNALSHAIDIVETMRDKVGTNEVGLAQFIEGSRIEPYHLMTDLLIREHKDREALAQAEHAKARVLLDSIQRGQLNVASVMTPDERARDRELSSQVSSLNRQVYMDRQRPQPDKTRLSNLGNSLDNARLEYESFRNGLFAAHPELRSQRPEAWHLDWSQLAKLASDNKTAFVEFVVTDEKTQAFVITGRSQSNKTTDLAEVSTYTIPMKKKELKDLVSTFADRLGNPHVGEDALSHKLHDLLLGPAKLLLGGKTSIVIVPDNILWDLPFQALRQTGGKYLVESYSISYAPSLSVLCEMIKKTKAQPRPLPGMLTATTSESQPLLLALGNPSLSAQTIERATSTHRDERLLPLPDAEKEVRTLAGFYPTGGTKIYIGADAREDKAKSEMSAFRTLHFATHGILDSNSPIYSHIVLSTDDKSSDDGLLEAWEIMGMNLKADLAILSACETARGRTGAGEGVIGMSWAFFVAGCPTTVVSQWKVDSASTSELMIEFHRNLVSRASGQEPAWKKAEGLRRAMLTLMKNPKYKDPYYWAGFVVVGAG